MLSLISPTPGCPVTIMFLLLLILILVTLFSVLPNYSYDISRFVSISANTFIFYKGAISVNFTNDGTLKILFNRETFKHQS